MADRSRGFALAFTADAYYLNGSRYDRTRPITDFSGLLRLVRAYNTLEEAVVLIDGDVMSAMGIGPTLPLDDDDYVTHHPSLATARRDGWNITELSPWMTFWAKGLKSIHIGLLPFLNKTSFPAYSSELGPMTYALKRLHDKIGVAYRMTPGTTFIGMVRDAAGRRDEPLWKPKWSQYEDSDSLTMASELPYQWQSTEDNPYGLVWQYDVNKQYLAAMSGAELAIDALTYHPLGMETPRRFDPGWYEFTVPAWNFPQFPHPAGPRAIPGSIVRRSAPTMALLVSLADRGFLAEPTIHRCWTSARRGRLLRTTAETIRDLIATAHLEDETTATVLREIGSGLYKRGFGMLRPSTSRIQRYDWSDTIAGLARSNLWRSLWTAYQNGRPAPLAIDADTVSYLGISHNRDDAIECGPLDLSDQIGKWKFRAVDIDRRKGSR